MTLQTKRPHVGQIALTAAFRNGSDVIGVPKCLASAHTPFGHGFGTGWPSQSLDMPELRYTIETAKYANPAIAFEDALA